MPGYCDPPKEYQFKPGQSGNPSGKPKGAVSLVRLIREALRENDEAAAKAIVKAAIDQAKEGNDKHLRMLLDRIDGPVVNKIEASVEQAFKAIDKEAADDV